MKPTEYTVVFLNGKKEIFYCFGVYSAYYAAGFFADSKGWNNEIDTITDENGNQYFNFHLKFEKRK